MNYGEHIAKFKAKQDEAAEAEKREAAERLVALRSCFTEAESIIIRTIRPEFDRLADEVAKHHITTNVRMTTSRNSELEADFTNSLIVEVDGHSLRVTAFPASKYFQFTTRVGSDRNSPPSEPRFEAITPEYVAAACADFLRKAFPA